MAKQKHAPELGAAFFPHAARTSKNFGYNKVEKANSSSESPSNHGMNILVATLGLHQGQL